MVVSPKLLIKKKIVTFPKKILIEKYIQQNGIDVDCLEIYDLDFDKYPVIADSISSFKPKARLIDPMEISRENMDIKGWVLQKGHAYTFSSSFEINIPNNMCGEVVGRSTFNRQGIFIRSSWYDAGFKGNIGGTIYCFSNVIIECGVRIGQVILREGESASLYKGQYQKEK